MMRLAGYDTVADIFPQRGGTYAKDVCDRHQILLRVVNSSYSAGLLLLRCQKKVCLNVEVFCQQSR